MAKHVSLHEATYIDLMNVISELVKKLKRPVTIDDAIKFLIDEYFKEAPR